MTREELQLTGTQKIIEIPKVILALSPRSGKTRITLDALKQLTGSILISVPSEFMTDVWKQECKKWNFPEEKLNFCCHASLHKQEQYDIIVIDEIHSAISEIRIAGIKKIKAERIIGLSGSLSLKAEEILQKQLDLQIGIKYTVDMAVSTNIVSDYRIYIHQIKMSEDEILSYNKLTQNVNWCKEFGTKKQLMFSSLKRARFLYNVKSKNEEIKRFIKELDRYLLFGHLISVVDSIVPYSHHSKSKINYVEQFKTGEINSLGVSKLLNEGITIPNLDTAIMVGMNSSEVSSIQRILRTMNNDTDDKLANIHIFISKDTKECEWTNKALQSFNQNKIIKYE